MKGIEILKDGTNVIMKYYNREELSRMIEFYSLELRTSVDKFVPADRLELGGN